MKVLVAKSYNFVDVLRASYITKNSTDLWYISIPIFNVYACYCECSTLRPLIEECEEDMEKAIVEEEALVLDSDEDEQDS